MTYYRDLNQFKEDNGYQIDGIWYPRVTSIVSIKAKPALYQFYASLPDFKTGEDIKEKSAREGTLIHDTIESIFRKESVSVAEPIKPAINSFMDFYQSHQIIPHKIEEKLISKQHNYAGTMDVLAEVDGKLGVLDIKTSVAIYRDYNLQTSAYVQALSEDPGMPPLTRWILRIDQSKKCFNCGASLRDKGGREKIRGGYDRCVHDWSEIQGEYEFKELRDFELDKKAFLACKQLWEWENDYWLRKT